ncbi:hypothetical protein R1sor_015616 [Riccia sorocarpa]|uniref:Uncharacterized protein n=1 Tax=Riccia sorocarpa TaxID=122646 RepID=A0ABD3HFS2_9MARC
MDGSGDGDVGDEQHIRDPSGDDGGTRGQHQQRPPNARQTTLPFGQPPPTPAHRTNYKDFGLPEPRTELSIKVMDQDSGGTWRHLRIEGKDPTNTSRDANERPNDSSSKYVNLTLGNVQGLQNLHYCQSWHLLRVHLMRRNERLNRHFLEA